MKRGTIILTPFPFTDLHGNKVRPALIISNDKRTGEDLIIAFISSIVDPKNLQEADILIRQNENVFLQSGLKTSSVIKADKLATINKNIILGELGSLNKEMMVKVGKKIKRALDLP